MKDLTLPTVHLENKSIKVGTNNRHSWIDGVRDLTLCLKHAEATW